MPTLRRPRYRDRRKARYRPGRAHPWPGGFRTRWTTYEISSGHRIPDSLPTSRAWSHCVDYDPTDPDDVAAGAPDTIPGSVRLRTEIIDFTGFMVQHCHILKHEELGMMQLIEIYDPAAPPTVVPGTDTPSRCASPSG